MREGFNGSLSHGKAGSAPDEEAAYRVYRAQSNIRIAGCNGFRIEELAREKMGLARENEFVVVVPGKQ